MMTSVIQKYVGDDVILFTTDGASAGLVKCGSLNTSYTTVDFGPGGDVAGSFAVQRQFQKQGPLVG